jgi:hypothetical protein
MDDRARGLGGAALAGGLAMLVLTAALALTWALRDREQAASIPSPPPLFELAFNDVGPGRQACTAPFVVDAYAAQARINVVARGRPTPPLDVIVSGGAYRASTTVPGGYAGPGELRVPIAPPPRAVVARACVTNRGRRPVALFASGEPRTDSRSVTRIGGRQVPDMTLGFFERTPVSLLRRAPQTARRMSTFRPVAPAAVAVLALLALLVPVGAVAATVRAAGQEGR